MYMQIRSDKGCICEIDVFTEEHPVTHKWNINMNCYINIANYSDFIINLLGYTTASQKAFAEDISILQDIRKNYFEETGYFPKPEIYDISDPQLNKDKHIIIDIIRRKMQEIASKWQLVYKED